jgi:Zn-dependent peptidase ImmA (M78 family)
MFAVRPDAPYDPGAALKSMGIPVLRVWLRDTLGVWAPKQRVVIIASGLSAVEERCVLAHEVEHAIAADGACGDGPADMRAERRADVNAARKLIALSQLCLFRQSAGDEAELAAALQVTRRVLRTRIADLDGDRGERMSGGVTGPEPLTGRRLQTALEH